MAELVLTRVGAVIGGGLFSGALRTFGVAAGRAAGAFVGGRLDSALFGDRSARAAEGPRMTALHLQGSTEGASIPATYGVTRIAGQIIWAARFREHVTVERTQTPGSRSGKGFGGGAPSTTPQTTTYSYTLSFAVGLCEGPVHRILRVWANGEPFDLSGVACRFYNGGETQDPDALIETIEGAANAPAYRGLSYIVFEDLPLDRFGNVVPQLSFEIVRKLGADDPHSLEQLTRGVCLIPGAGEFVYADQVVSRILAPGVDVAENVHAVVGRANLAVSLDQLAEDFPNCRSVMLVVSWFGDDLRCGACQIRPGVEAAEKTTFPLEWRAGDVDRGGAHLISTHNGGPAYGGTPADATVVEAIRALKARGYAVGLYPFILIDVPLGNSLADPYGASAQAAYPWRGRITCHPAQGRAGTPDKTSAAATQIANFVGAASPAHFAIAGDEVSYSGPAEWSFRRFILHCAHLAAAAGGVDSFLLGSELRGMTKLRESATNFPFVTALKNLAADVRGVLGGATKLTYAADWSEYNGHQPQDGTGDVFFHLDPLWADSAIDCVGVDWYPPLTDWRAGIAHADGQIARSIYDPDYLEGRIEAGENFDFYYASEADRKTQTRTAISDGACGKPWVFRTKDLRSWWSNPHYNRPGGVESVTSTAWIPQSKPIWLVELGCPAIDKGSNSPNLFIDPKSSESGRPPFSNGRANDLIQRRALEAYLRHWAGATNPVSSVYHAPMIEVDRTHLWCWDARPFPQFPARRDVWSDGANWRLGHWLNGRVGPARLADVVRDLCRRAGVTDADTSLLSGIVSGYVVDSPASARAAIEPLAAAFDFDAVEEEGRIVFRHHDEAQTFEIGLEDAVQRDDGRIAITRADGADAPVEARVRFIDPERDHAIAMISARQRDAAGDGVITIDAPLSLTADDAGDIADHALAVARARIETAEITLPPSLLSVTPGDKIIVEGAQYSVQRIEEGPERRASLARHVDALERVRAGHTPAAAPLVLPSIPDFALLDLPPLPGFEDDARPLAACFAAPWTGPIDIYAGETLASATWRGHAQTPAIMGTLQSPLAPGALWRWDEANVIRARLSGTDLSSVEEEALRAGANTFAVETTAGDWEVLQAASITLVAPGVYELRHLLRGQLGTERAMEAAAGARIVKLDQRLARVAIGAHENGAALNWYAVAAPAGPGSSAAALLASTYRRAWARPYAPVDLAGLRTGAGDVELSWVRRSRMGGDDWASLEIPLAEEREAYLVEIMDGADVIRRAEVAAPAWIYPAADQIADFGAPPASLTVRVAQISSTYGPGARAESTIWL
jgi:hypothetical protein